MVIIYHIFGRKEEADHEKQLETLRITDTSAVSCFLRHFLKYGSQNNALCTRFDLSLNSQRNCFRLYF